MSANKKPRGKIVRRLGVNIYGNPKFDRLLERKPNAPGQHGGKRRKRPSDYGVQLIEKQKLRFSYGMGEKQFRTVFARAKQMQGITGDNMIALLERRFDNVIYRLGFAKSRAQARQMVKHRHFQINGRSAHTPSMLVSSGDAINVREKEVSQRLIRDLVATNGMEVPGWLQADDRALSAMMIRNPMPEDTPQVADIQLVVEYYSK